jgi:hypothetical protein
VERAQRERVRGALTLAGVVATLPISWHALRAVHTARLRRFAQLRARASGSSDADLARIEAGGVSRALELTRVTYSMASGPEEEVAIEIVWSDGTRSVLLDREAGSAVAALAARGIAVRRAEAHAGSIGSLFGWLFWALSCVVLAAALTGEIALWVLAAAGLVAIVALLRS